MQIVDVSVKHKLCKTKSLGSPTCSSVCVYVTSKFPLSVAAHTWSKTNRTMIHMKVTVYDMYISRVNKMKERMDTNFYCSIQRTR
jgi:hypothetical protein